MMFERPFEEVVVHRTRNNANREAELRDMRKRLSDAVDDFRFGDEGEKQAIDDGADRVPRYDISQSSECFQHAFGRIQLIPMSDDLGPQCPIRISHLRSMVQRHAAANRGERIGDFAGKPGHLQVEPGVAADECIVKIERDCGSHRAPSPFGEGYGSGQSAANGDCESSASRAKEGSLIAVKKASTIRESNWVPLLRRISATAASNESALR